MALPYTIRVQDAIHDEKGKTKYVIKVSRGKENVQTSKRYSELEEWYKMLLRNKQLSSSKLPFPPKSSLGSMLLSPKSRPAEVLSR